MSKSAPFNIVVNLFAPVWEADEKYKGEPYPRSGMDEDTLSILLTLLVIIVNSLLNYFVWNWYLWADLWTKR